MSEWYVTVCSPAFGRRRTKRATTLLPPAQRQDLVSSIGRAALRHFGVRGLPNRRPGPEQTETVRWDSSRDTGAAGASIRDRTYRRFPPSPLDRRSGSRSRPRWWIYLEAAAGR